MKLFETTSIDEHLRSCDFPGCTGSIWRDSHSFDSTTPTSGRREDVVDESAVTVMLAYDKCEDSGPRILLGLGGSDVDVDVSPTPAQARRIAIKLLEAADAHDGWAAR
jgi:hypothetical protein